MDRIKSIQFYRIIILLFFIFFSFGAIAQEKEKKISIQNKSISIKEAFSEIEQQTDYSIAYEQLTLDLNKKISLSLKNVNIDKALKEILNDRQHTYKINGYHIIISPINKEYAPDNSIERPTQTIRGIVTDSKSNTPIEYATISILRNPSLGTVTDSLGEFCIKDVPVGRYNIQTSYMGYHTNIVNEILVTSSKEIYLDISLNENMQQLNEIVVHPEVKKAEPVNPMAITGGRMISMEEASRFANGFDDPARLSSAFAGVAGGLGTNAIAIRGNSPQYTQWRLEGIEIPNPTHFADLAGLGGGILSALSTQMIGNSDFYNGAFPAEYSNALSGVFDFHIRNGNNQKYEYAFQLGLMGIDLASEGPISKKRGSSYLFNYRFSTTSLASGGESNLKYQDLSFKFHLPTKKAGTFSIWGLGLIDKNKADAEERSKWETQVDRQSAKNNMTKLVGGITHKYFIDENTYLRSSLSATYSEDHISADQQTLEDKSVPVGDIRNRKWDIVFNSFINKKISPSHTNRSGITITGLNYNLDYKVSPNFSLNKPMEQISKGDGESIVLSAFSSSVLAISRNVTASLGITSQYFALNDNWSLEPRVALKWKPVNRYSFSVAYGLHSRREKLDYYFIEQDIDGKKTSNKYLDFSRAHHIGFSYDWNISSNLHLKIESYYQYLYDMPVEENSSFSLINHEDFYLNRILINKGAGKNYGIDITLEQYMTNGVYYMLTGSVFKSKYKGGDNIWRNTRMDRGFLLNALAGKEWMVGKRKQNMFSVNTRLFFHGGDRYTPIDEDKTNEEHDIILNESNAFSKKFSPILNGDISVNYRINKRKLSHEFSLKMLNVGIRTGMHFYEYNEKTNKIKKENSTGIIPNLSYKLYF
ncbi:carboxypeptidase-like regulatory domain-containing protein [uncultured Parabacteroides sp.]|jgi:hypothetical protein|uniref:carboxypeptidase-like regulatory domain-containing protein n=1 Tax=uncultured Parabacteroides sp. TaxID=512312 RepID=UPI0025EDE840|nr:carboxypeptidase-like regulatory domain-containing protein [uncultured Parabacteroides sp.]